jgi:hypothetical protein
MTSALDDGDRAARWSSPFGLNFASDQFAFRCVSGMREDL